MQPTPFLSQVAYSCPVCRSGRFVTYRRHPGADGTVVNRCTCRRCGMQFEHHEDRHGRPVRGK